MRASVVALLLAASPAVLHADNGTGWVHFNNYCTTGTFRSCASVSVGVVVLPDGTRALVLSLQNLQGTHPADTRIKSLLSSVSISFPGTLDPDDLTDSDSPWGLGGDPNGKPIGQWGSGGAQDSWTNSYSANIAYAYSGIAGCDAPNAGEYDPLLDDGVMGGPTTCPGQGYTGVVYGVLLNIPDDWTIQNAEVSWFFTGPNGSAICQPGINCEQVTVTPEPTTLVLLGSGLVGLAGLRRRRRPEGQSSGG